MLRRKVCRTFAATSYPETKRHAMGCMPWDVRAPDHSIECVCLNQHILYTYRYAPHTHTHKLVASDDATRMQFVSPVCRPCIVGSLRHGVVATISTPWCTGCPRMFDDIACVRIVVRLRTNKHAFYWT